MIEFSARRLEIEGLEDGAGVRLQLNLADGVGVAAGRVRAFTEGEDPNKQLTRIEFIFTRDFLEAHDVPVVG